VDLLCAASERPSICLWRTPYGSIYTVGGGRTWESGRLAASPLAGDAQCGLHIRGVAEQDQGAWQCEVGAVIGGEFTTTTAETSIKILHPGGKYIEKIQLSKVFRFTPIPNTVHQNCFCVF
jgi:hypothetical protein